MRPSVDAWVLLPASSWPNARVHRLRACAPRIHRQLTRKRPECIFHSRKTTLTTCKRLFPKPTTLSREAQVRLLRIGWQTRQPLTSEATVPFRKCKVRARKAVSSRITPIDLCVYPCIFPFNSLMLDAWEYPPLPLPLAEGSPGRGRRLEMRHPRHGLLVPLCRLFSFHRVGYACSRDMLRHWTTKEA